MLRFSKGPENSRYTQVKRLFQMTVFLSIRGRFVTECAEKFNVSRKTARRDIWALEEMGLPIYCDSVSETRELLWRIDPHWIKQFS